MATDVLFIVKRISIPWIWQKDNRVCFYFELPSSNSLPECPRPCSQEPTNFPYPQQHKISQHPTVLNIFKIYFNIMHPSTPRYNKWSLSFRFPHPNNVCILLSHVYAACHATVSNTFRICGHIHKMLPSSCLSVRPHGRTRLPLDRFPWNLIWGFLGNESRKFKLY